MYSAKKLSQNQLDLPENKNESDMGMYNQLEIQSADSQNELLKSLFLYHILGIERPLRFCL